MKRKVEVYGDLEGGWYEWRIVDGDRVMQDTGNEGDAFCRGRQYGQAEIALRDALIFASGMQLDSEASGEFSSLEEGYAAKAKAEKSKPA
jgi:hypothetical protein